MKENAAEFHVQQDDVFGRIASRYDFLCDLFSLGIHRLWKRKIAQIIAQKPWTELFDCATGTGDINLRVLRNKDHQNEQKIIASDISPQMLAIAQKRLATANSSVEFRLLDAHSIPHFSDESVDLYSISLGLKICERRKYELVCLSAAGSLHAEIHLCTSIYLGEWGTSLEPKILPRN
jgi:demethylmenaquinone methyltransferase/2-methoxy-6-polyprenyl-1,4-benzoquinol methylase